MGLSSWLKERRLERTHRKLKQLRARQSRLREEENEVQEQIKNGAPSVELEAKAKRLHEERERTTHQVGELQAEEERLKAELKALAA